MRLRGYRAVCNQKSKKSKIHNMDIDLYALRIYPIAAEREALKEVFQYQLENVKKAGELTKLFTYLYWRCCEIKDLNQRSVVLK